MALHLVVFALLGLAVVALAWMMAPASEQVSFPAGLAFGVVGSLLGGLLTWHYWPMAESQFNAVAILPALLGAGILFWAYRSYAQFEGAD